MSVGTRKKVAAELKGDELKEVLERADRNALTAEDCQLLRSVIESYAYLTDLVEDKRTSIDRLRRLLFGARTEKTRKVLDEPENVDTTPAPSPEPEPAPPAAKVNKKPKSDGHGRNSRCGAAMKIIAVVTDHRAIDKILEHLSSGKGHDPFEPRAPPEQFRGAG